MKNFLRSPAHSSVVFKVVRILCNNSCPHTSPQTHTCDCSFGIKVSSNSLISKEYVASCKDVLCKKEEKIDPLLGPRPQNSFGVIYYPDDPNLHLSTRLHHGTLMGFLLNISDLEEQKLGQTQCCGNLKLGELLIISW